MDNIQRPDFSLKNAVSPDAVMQMFQRKGEQDAQMKLQREAERNQAIQNAVHTTSNMVSSMVAQSKEKSKKDFIESYADLVALQAAGKDNDKYNMINAAVKQDPNTFAKQIADHTFPDAAATPVGAPPRSFESYLVSQVNNGKMNPEEAAKQLGRLKPSNTIIGYDNNNQPIYSNSKAVPGTADPLHTESFKGEINSKPERISEGELSKESDINSLDIAMAEVERTFEPSFVGAVEGRLNTLQQMVPGVATEKRAEFLSALSSYRNSMIKAITGAQMSEPEAKRIMRQLPDEKMSETDFQAKLRISQKMLKQALMKRQDQLRDAGYRGVPSAKPAKSSAPMMIDQSAIDAELKRRGL